MRPVMSCEKKRRMPIRLYAHDLKGMQKRRRSKKGIPYQTLIAGMFHQYLEGGLVESRKV